MSFTDDFLKALNKQGVSINTGNTGSGKITGADDFTKSYLSALEQEEEKKKKKKKNGRFISTVGTLSDDDDIAPVKSKEDDSLLDFFQKGSFEDGYQFGDVAKAILGTAGDAGLNVVKGIAGLGEGVGDLVGYGIAGVADLAGKDEYAEGVRKRASVNLVDQFTKGAEDYLNQYSVLGRTSDAAMQGVGQVAGIIATGSLGAAAGLGAGGVTALTTGTMGLSGMGSGMGEAYQGGATDEEALLYGTIAGASDAISELIFGGLGRAVNATGLSVGLSSADDMLAKKVSSMFSNQIMKNISEFGIKAGAEGLEEVLAGIAQAAGKKATYMSEEEWGKIVKDENLLEQFVVGAVTSGIAQAPSLHIANNTKTDFVTGQTQNEQAVIKKEIENRIAEAEKDGKKLTAKEKSKIEAQVEKDMEKGYISTDTIEEVLGGETYQRYKQTVDSENALAEQQEALQEKFDTLNKMKQGEMTGEQIDRRAELKEELAKLKETIESTKNHSQRNLLKQQLSESVSEMVRSDRLIESYNERTRRGQAFEADLSKYDEKQKAVIQKAVDSGILNNTNRTHEFVDMVAKISADKGVLFDFTNNAKLKESGFAVDGAFVNGYWDKKSGTIGVNVNSEKALNTIVGHEITHVLEGTALYNDFQKIVVEYAKTKGDYQGRFDALSKLYDADDVPSELTADLVGDYLFTDADFINNLSTNHRNVFQKIYDEVKYLLKVATAGSKEAKELEKVKRAFDKAYREGATKNTADSGATYSIERTKSMSWDEQIQGALYNGKNIRRNDTLIVGNPAETSVANEIDSKPLAIPLSVLTKASSGKDISHSIKKGKLAKLDEGIKNAPITIVNPERNAVVYVTGIKQGGLPVIAAFDMNATFDGDEVHKATSIHLQVDTESMLKSLPESATVYVRKNELDPVGATNNLRGLAAKIKFIEGNVAQAQQDVKRKYSLSDSNGRQLTNEQQEFFKDSVVRDENGNLKVMYHGTSKGGHTVFDPYGKANYGLFGTGSYFTDSKTIGDSYTKKGKGKNPQVYETYLNIKNPIDMDAAADPAAWAKAMPDVQFPESGTNEDFYRAMEEYFEDNEYARWEAAETAMYAIEDMGYDGITHIGGGRVNADGERHRVYIAFYPEQIKNVDNAKPTENPDIRYSLSDTDGKELTREQAEFFKDSKIRDRDGNLRVVYHTTKNDFTVFDKSRKGEATDGPNTFLGFFFAESPDHMEQFPEFQNGKTDAYYLDMKKPMDLTNLSKEAFMDIVELTGGDRTEAAEAYDQELDAEKARARFRGDNNTSLSISQLLYNMVGDYYHADFFEALKPNYDKLVAKGYDGVIDYLDEMMGEREFVVFDSNQAKLTTNTKPTGDPDIRYSLSNAETDKTYLDAVNSGDMDTARKIMEQVAKRRGYTIHAYHGTARGDRVGNVFLPERATSGPMAFFTDNKEIAENYSKSKQDTSMAYDPDYDRYETQFRIKVLDRDIPLYRAWGFLPFDARRRITQKAGQLRENWDGDNELILDPDTNEANGGFQWQLKEARGNAIQALTEQWLNSGNLFNEEARFLEVLEMAGVTEEFKKVNGMGELYFKDPNAKHEKVYDTFLRIRKPFDTATVDEQFIADLEAWYEEQDESKYVRQNMQSDMWDKNGIDAYDFADRLRSDLENNTTHAWTSIPDSVTDYLKHLGYDGIKDTGGKFTLEGHTVWIPFASSQIKSAETVTYDDSGNVIPITERFNKKDIDIRQSLSNDGQQQKQYGNYNVYGKDIALETEEIAPVAENATTEATTAPVEATTAEMAEMFPDELTPQTELNNLLQEQEALENRMTEMGYSGDLTDFESVNGRWMEVSARIEELETEISESESGRVNSLGDEDVPPEMDAPYYEPTKPESTPDPFMGRDMDEVAKNRKVKAYQYENPEVKPFFQDAALGMLGDLNDTIPGEKIFNDEVYYASGGEKGWMGTKRQTTDDIAWLKDTYGYTYDQIRDGVNAIIEDDGKENNAVSKRIEYLLHERLVNGYTGVWGEPFPPNQEYINFLKEREISEYSREAFDSFMATADQYAPPADDDIAPVAAPAAQTPAPEDIAPIKEEYIATTPKRKKEPKMVRADKPFDQKTATILVEEPKVQKKNNGLWSMVKENILDNGMVFEDLALKTKNRDLQAKWNFIRYAQSMAQRMVGNGTENVKALNTIREEVEKSGKTQEFYEYLYHWLNVDRMTLENRYDDTPNKAVFGDTVTADMSRVIAVQLGKKNPEFRRWAQEVYNYNRHLRTMMVNNGVISQETADLWQEMYPHYVPIRRVGDTGLNINVPLDTGRTSVNAPVKKATGGNSDILPLFDTMAQRTLQTYKAIAKNSFGVELKNTLGTTITKEKTDVDGVIDSVDNHEELLQEGKKGQKPTFTVFENGEKVTFEITDEMYNAMKPASDLMSYTNPVLNTISNFHRGLLTEYNPVFMATNAIKDTQDILINSQHPVRTYANLPRATWEIAKNGKWFREYMEHGGEDNTYFDGEDNSFNTEEKGARKLLGIPPLSWISKANNFIERTPRLAEYIASREAGRSIEVSMLDAARVTTNFAAGGRLTKLANRNGATFLNASVQGVVQQARNFREAKMNGFNGWAQLAGKFALAGLPVLLLNHLMWDDDEEYEELSDYVKQNYYIVGKYGDGKFVRIPKGRTLAVIQGAFEQMENLITGNDEVDLKSFVDLVRSNLAPNNPWEDNIFAPIKQVAKNTTWYGEDLVPTRLQDLPAAEQFDESTDSISKWLGEKLNFSPYKINYLLDQYSGGVGDTVLPMLTPEAESGDNTLLGNVLAPWKSKFTTDSVMNNQNVSDFYDLRDELSMNAKASVATDEDKLMYKYINSVNSELSALYAKKRVWQNSGFPADVKYEKVYGIQQQIVDLMKEGMSNYQNISYEDEYAKIGDRLYMKNDEGEWQKLSDEQVTKYEVTKAAGDAPYATDGTNHYRWYEPGEDAGSDAEPGWRKVTEKELERQNEITSALGITPEEYWGNKDEYSYAYENPENYAVAKAVGGYDAYKQYSSELNDISADKDKYGKSISGSRKAKVQDYINNLDADYYTKLILFKSEYTSYDAENYEIIEYLNEREDISFEEMRSILIKLGFKVDSEGNISW